MPKGVEHRTILRVVEIRRLVQSSPMPKGVEHLGEAESARIGEHVQSSPMPKGVEHKSLIQKRAIRAGAVISDAERR